MPGFLQRELAVARQQLLIALRRERSARRLRAEKAGDHAVPAAEECLRLIESRSAEYALALSRYRGGVERVLERARLRSLAGLQGEPAPGLGLGGGVKRRYSFGARRTAARANSAIPAKKVRRG